MVGDRLETPVEATLTAQPGAPDHSQGPSGGAVYGAGDSQHVSCLLMEEASPLRACPFPHPGECAPGLFPGPRLGCPLTHVDRLLCIREEPDPKDGCAQPVPVWSAPSCRLASVLTWGLLLPPPLPRTDWEEAVGVPTPSHPPQRLSQPSREHPLRSWPQPINSAIEDTWRVSRAFRNHSASDRKTTVQ